MTTISDLKKEIASLTKESEKLRSELETFISNRERLGKALKAAELDGDFATLTADPGGKGRTENCNSADRESALTRPEAG